VYWVDACEMRACHVWPASLKWLKRRAARRERMAVKRLLRCGRWEGA
jgi:hypothetical protein